MELEHYKHSNFVYKGIPIENHKSFLNVKTYRVAVQTEQILKGCMNPQRTTLARGEVLTPSADFNTLFIAFHAGQHYGRGLALHHLCDWAVLIRRFGLHLPKEMTDKRFLGFISAITVLCNRYLGTSVQVSGGEELAEEVLGEMLAPKYPDMVPVKNKVRILVFKTKRLLHRYWLTNRIFHISIVKRLWISIVDHVRRPHTIFSRVRG